MAGIDPRLWQLILKYAPSLRLDPRAVASVAMAESGGRFGAVGDNNSSYGPWQLHRGGALPAGWGLAQADGPRGVLYAMQRMSQVAGGLHGNAAVAAIVRQFERPAAPGPEVQRSIGYYGQLGGQPGRVPTGGGAAGGGGSVAAALAMLLGLKSPQAAQHLLTVATPQSILQSVDQQPLQPGQPEIGTVPAPQPTQFLTPGGSTTNQLQSSLDATRAALLKV